MTRTTHLGFVATVLVALLTTVATGELQLKRGDHICYIGNTTADRMQHHGWLETYLTALHPQHNLVFRNLGFPGDTLKTRSRSANFGSPDQWLAKCEADVVFCFFGYNEAFAGEAGVAGFEKDLAGLIDYMRGQKYNGKSAPQLVFFSPIAHENLNSPHLPDGTENNHNLQRYTTAMKKVCADKQAQFVDLFAPTQAAYADADKPLTMNGIHLLDHGNHIAAKIALSQLLPQAALPAEKQIDKLKKVILDKNYHWFSRYRVVDGYNVYGGRSRLAWHGQSNADVMRREMEIFDVMTANRDERVWAVAKGGDLQVKDDNLPKELVVQPNRRGPLENGAFPYLGGKEAIDKMKVAEGMEVNLYASEEMFPRLINPVQMAVDTDSRLWASVWPSYPHWNPTEPRKDALVILPDDNQDGVADDCIVFADELNSITGFEFWGGGVLVFAPPELWFLKDTDGDNKADVKIRLLQGISSADTHHSANAVVVGPDGWLYWSRGIFNVANFETPTKTYRSGKSGVHRFNPRTFEVEFHFPIGPNPHGDVFDRWGYQFANDGTGGTGSYINIGKGIGNKQWFQKRVRPVPATGILSSSHFPPANEGNFLICNAIGFLGVLQHEVQYDGADITAVEIEPIVYSSDPNFRPTDLEVGGDGALYISDWCNTLIGHMQHNMRDPNRDHVHGRIYRVTAKGRPLLKPVRMKDKPVAEVCENFFAQENGTRYRARLELSGRAADDMLPQVLKWASNLSAKKAPTARDEAQALLECLWVFEEHRVPNVDLLRRVFQAEEPRVRAASIRTLGHWAGKVENFEELLVAAARDEAALVRAEAVKSAVEFGGLNAAEVIFETATRPTDAELDAVLKYGRSRIDVDAIISESLKSGKELSAAGKRYALQKASPAALASMDRTPAVNEALLSRGGIPTEYRWEAIQALAQSGNRAETAELVAWIQNAEKNARPSLDDLAKMLSSASKEKVTGHTSAIQELVSTTETPSVRVAAYAAWLRASTDTGPVWKNAYESRETIFSLLRAARNIEDPEIQNGLYASVRGLMLELPKHLKSDRDNPAVAGGGPAVSYKYYQPHAADAKLETLSPLKPKLTGKSNNFQVFVPKGARDQFATMQTTNILIPRPGKYTFYTASDDGSRLYVDKQLVVNNDGNHAMVEKGGAIELTAGAHELIVNYFDSGGGDGLRVMWQGPGFAKQTIPTSSLSAVGSGNLRVQAIQLVANWKGHFDEKVADLTKLTADKDVAPAALDALASLPVRRVADKVSPANSAAVLQVLLAQAGKATPVQKQSDEYSRWLNLGDNLVARVDSDTATLRKTLADLRASIPVKADPKVMALGKQVFHRHSHCATCHQTHGQGLPNLYPPLDGSLWVTGSEDRLIRIVLDGMHGTIDVKGKTYSSPPLPPMTGFRQLLNDQEVAAVVTYVRNTWTNRAKPIEAAKVASVRKIDRQGATFWYAADLLDRYPLEDGRVVKAVRRPDGWVPKFVKAWKAEDFPETSLGSGQRSFDTGKAYFKRLGCSQCHKLGGEGGVFGPDLAKLDAKKRNVPHILSSILDPSKEIEDKFAMQQFVLDSGKVVSGLIIGEDANEVRLITDPLAPNKPTIVKKDEIDERAKTKASIMPQGLLNWLTREEVLDLIAYVYSSGKADDDVFKK